MYKCPICHYQDASGNNSVIDHIFVSENLLSNVVEYYAHDSGINMSDHLPACVLSR